LSAAVRRDDVFVWVGNRDTDANEIEHRQIVRRISEADGFAWRWRIAVVGSMVGRCGGMVRT
jgi:hypothetical protein